MTRPASELAQRLAQVAEAVCLHYLSNGRRAGNYWLVGNVDNEPGRSLYVRLKGPLSGPGAAGRWTDAATGEHGDLLDIVSHALGRATFRQAAAEARRFLNLPQSEAIDRAPAVDRGSSEAARRLLAITVPIQGTLAERYLRQRGIVQFRGCSALRFHPRCYHRDTADGEMTTYPALIAAITDLDGNLTGVHRTWLDARGNGKAPVEFPRRAMGSLLGSGVRLGMPADQPVKVVAVGEGLETVLSLRTALPCLPMIAGLSAAHLGALVLPHGLHRLYIAGDADAAGRCGAGRLAERARADGIEVLSLRSRLGDFNDDLRRLGLAALRTVVDQLHPEDRVALVRPE